MRYPDRDDPVVEFLTQALALAPEDVETLVALGDAHHTRGRVDDAERWARAALEAASEHADALVLLGHVLLRRGHVRGAREHAVWAFRTEVTDPDAPRLLAAIKARESLLLGLWFRVSSVLAALGPPAMLVLLATRAARPSSIGAASRRPGNARRHGLATGRGGAGRQGWSVRRLAGPLPCRLESRAGRPTSA
ncbi:hypothetical protein BE20_25800 [Sorangium cellulosum]|uniref:Tetratricopeptide repeat protein n=1 Tax=Sorangium cellulosum TaxID=56 RepID=A0A150S4Y0_SORCE|nr:hypothetical protein BE20_25800 [Sorangium cellulosum]KYF88665.1 hypothetical protein BE18_14340 [Sorangium cellulosum]